MPARPRHALRRTAIGLVLVVGVGLVLFFLFRDTPSPPASAVPLDPLPQSTLSIPVSYTVGPALESTVPRSLATERRPHPSDANLQYAFEAQRDSFTVTLRNDTLHLHTTLHYRSRVWYRTPFGIELTASCGFEPPEQRAARARIHLAAPVELDSTWTLHAPVEIVRLMPPTDADRCRVAFMNLQLMDATEPILTAARYWLDQHTEVLTEQLAALPLAEMMERHWTTLHAPIPLFNDAWLTLHPHALRYQTTSSKRPNQLDAQVHLGVQPHLHLGTAPVVSPPTLLPAPTRADAEAADSLVHVETHLPYEMLTDRLHTAIGTQTFDVGPASVSVDDVQVTGTSSGRLAVTAQVAGTMNGRIRLEGTPAFDATLGRADLLDLDITAHDADTPLRLAVQVVRYRFMEPLQYHLRRHLADALVAAEAWSGHPVDTVLAPGVQLSGHVGAPRFAGWASQPETLVVRAQVSVRLGLTIQPPPS